MNWQNFSQLVEVNKEIDLKNPDFQLLNLAIFQATNKFRIQEKLSPFQYDVSLEKAANGHSNDMINLNFIDHFNTQVSSKKSPDLRIKLESKSFVMMAENVAQLDVLNLTNNQYCYEPQQNGGYIFFDCNTKKLLKPLSYWALATKLVTLWINSPGHRANMLDAKLVFLGCGSAFSQQAFKTNKPPFCRATQNFGSK